MTTCAFNREQEHYLHKDAAPPDARVISVLPENIPLLANAPVDENIIVCSSNVLPRDKLRIDAPEATLAACRSAFDTPAEAGGARPLTESEREAYRLVRLVQNAPSRTQLSDYFATKLDPAIRKHPAWISGLGFATADATSWSLACTLAELCDILRFSQSRGRMKDRLRKYFRLITARQFLAYRRMPRGTPITSRGVARLVHLTQAWIDMPTMYMPATIMPQIPHAFLLRTADWMTIQYVEEGVDEDEARSLGYYRATLRFLDFVRMMWLQGLGVIEFDPFKFFDDEHEAMAFVDYVDRIS